MTLICILKDFLIFPPWIRQIYKSIHSYPIKTGREGLSWTCLTTSRNLAYQINEYFSFGNQGVRRWGRVLSFPNWSSVTWKHEAGTYDLINGTHLEWGKEVLLDKGKVDFWRWNFYLKSGNSILKRNSIKCMVMVRTRHDMSFQSFIPSNGP